MADEPSFIDPAEDCEYLPARELFRRLGFEPLPPHAVDDFQLRGRLWEFIYAMAGRRIWLSNTDHLNDRELYTWLNDVWLNEEVADIPPEAEWNTHVDPTEDELLRGEFPVTWLRYYASEPDRVDCAADFPGETLPPCEEPPFDRDRWLPEPFYPPAEIKSPDDLPFFLKTDEECSREDHRTEDDPLGLEAVDAAIEANQLRNQTRDEQATNEPTTREEHAAITSGESERWQRPLHRVQHTMSLPPPDELTDDTLHAKLWELLHSLACTGFYVLHTNHLSDRELYAALWHHGLREEALLPGKIKTGGWYHDVLGGWGEGDIQVWLRFYATNDERAQHARDWLNDVLPTRTPAPFNRDWRLPKGPIP